MNELHDGDMGGISGADRLCYEQAGDAGLSGSFRAVLTSRLQSLRSLVYSRYQALPVINSQVCCIMC